MTDIVYTHDVASALHAQLEHLLPSGVIIIADSNTASLSAIAGVTNYPMIVVESGERHKTLATVEYVWQEMERLGATRHSVVVNLGGGMVTDLGGFAAGCYKRGLRFVNVPTTLLAAVDAAVGGKTGVNFAGLKNEIGLFKDAETTIISTQFLSSLPRHELLSGFGEIIKHAILESESELSHILSTSIDCIDLDLISRSVNTKMRIVKHDHNETGLRQVLNLGHTVGHAIEEYALSRGVAVAHGYAVAWGLVVECVAGHLMLGFPSSMLHRLASFVRDNYGEYNITCNDYDTLIALMRRDKKSREGEIICALPATCGDVRPNVIVSLDDMRSALDIYRDLMGI